MMLMKIMPKIGLTHQIKKMLAKLPRTPMYVSLSIFLEEELLVKASIILNAVIEIQNKELYQVAFCFELNPFNTAYELIQPPNVVSSPTAKKKHAERRITDFVGI